MRDAARVRQRFLVAMGLFAAACEDDPAPPATAADANADTATVDGLAGSDTAAASDTAVSDTAASDTTGSDVAATDAMAETDATAGSDAAPADAATDSADAAGSDAAGPDAQFVCPMGGTANEQCLTSAELLAILNNPPMGGKAIPYDGPLPPQGCPPREKVLDGCCQAAATEGVLQGDRCCYVWCPGACCGRPLYAGDVAVVAQPQASGQWCAPQLALADEWTAEQRLQLAAAWLADGLDEHASIASFARFALDLLSLGAPPELVRDAALAMQDEVRHAEQCLTLARVLSGTAQSPAPLPLAGVTAGRDLRTAALSALHEGCVGETLAAAVLAEAARGAAPALVEPLLLMAADETRHAELSWRFVAWALRQDAASGGTAGLHAALTAAAAELAVAGVAPDPRAAALRGLGDAARQWGGRLAAGQHAVVCARALHEVALPCLHALLATTGPAEA